MKSRGVYGVPARRPVPRPATGTAHRVPAAVKHARVRGPGTWRPPFLQVARYLDGDVSASLHRLHTGTRYQLEMAGERMDLNHTSTGRRHGTVKGLHPPGLFTLYSLAAE